MNAEDLVLNIAVNMGRLSRWSTEGRLERIKQFLIETNGYLVKLDEVEVSEKFKPTLERFKKDFELLKKDSYSSMEFAEKALTWANILQHRAKLA